MKKEFCIKFKEKRGWLKRWKTGFYVVEGYKMPVVLREFREHHPDAYIIGKYVEYRKR